MRRFSRYANNKQTESKTDWQRFLALWSYLCFLTMKIRFRLTFCNRIIKKIYKGEICNFAVIHYWIIIVLHAFQFLLCVSPSVSFSLHYLTCPSPSSFTSPVPDPVVSVSVYLVFVLPALISSLRHPSASVCLSVMFSSVFSSLSSCVFPIAIFGFWFCVSLVIWTLPFSLHFV